MLPVILLAFADYRTDSDKHLRELGDEQDGIMDALRPAEEAGLCQVEYIANVTAEKLIEAFNRWPVAVFHFAGHANGFKLMLEESIYGEGLASFLAKQTQLELIFLNACATAGHAQALRQAGIPRVITTARAINDTTAREFAIDFYTHIGKGKGIDHAFAQYPHRHKMKNTDLRGLYWKGMHEAFIEGFPWKLHPEESDAPSWSLSIASDDPLYGLPPIPQRFDLPETPFRYLHWFERKHAEVFFGRAHQIRQLYEQLGTSPVTLLYGRSGVGKSSLLHAGLFPRLEESHVIVYLRRDPNTGLAAMMATLLKEKKALKEAWIQREEEAQKPLLVIMDQVEEAFTRPTEGVKPQDEILAFARQLYTIFGNPERRPKGSIILAFRKEYFAEINKTLAEEEVPKVGLFLEPMRREDIVASVLGLVKNERLSQFYKLTIEDGLAGRIADDLLEDDESAIAPVLQILLTRLWEQATSDPEVMPCFNQEGYLDLKKEGLLLSDFIDRQLKKLEEKCPDWLNSGLLHDMLLGFTTIAGTSARLDWASWKARYDHDDAALNRIRQYLIDSYLIIAIGGERYQLAHDTLAPLIRLQYELSDRPGQRADRLLRGKIRLGKDASVLSLHELEIVEKGKNGRKKLTDQEELIVGEAYVFWEENRKKEAAEEFVIQALQAQDLNPTYAFELSQKAWETAALPQALRSMHTAYYKDIFLYKKKLYATPMYTELACGNSYIDYTCFHPDGKSIWASWKNDSLVRYSLLGDEMERFQLKGGRVYKIQFNKKGDRMLLATFRGAVELWNTTEQKAQFSTQIGSLSTPIKQAVFSHHEKHIISGGLDHKIHIWDLEGNNIQTLEDHSDRVNDLAIGPDGMLISVSNDGHGFFWKEYKDGYRRGPISTDSEEKTLNQDEFILAVDLHVVNGLLMYGATASWDRTAKAWLITGVPDGTGEVVCYQIRELLELTGHADRVHYTCFSPDGNTLLTSSWDATVKLWNMNGDCLTTLYGHTEGIFSANFSPDGRYVVSGSSDGRLLLWDLESKPIRDTVDKVPTDVFNKTRTRAIHTRKNVSRQFPNSDASLEYNGREAEITFENGKVIQVSAPSGGGLESYADISPDGRFIVLPNGIRQCRVFDKNGNEVASFSEPYEEMLVLARFSKDGKYLITLSDAGKCYYWPFLAD